MSHEDSKPIKPSESDKILEKISSGDAYRKPRRGERKPAQSDDEVVQRMREGF